MSKELRETTLRTLRLGGVIDLFRRGRLPVEAGELVERVFGSSADRGSLVISGANGIVGAGKTMQLGSRLEPLGVPVVALDLPGAADGIGAKYAGLERAFGRRRAGRIMANIQRLSYDGESLPAELHRLRPRFLLEAVPEILELKKAHYRIFQEAFPGIEIRSVTSGFPSSELGVGIAHPAFPHEINKIWEVVEPEPSAVTRLLWALGLIPVPVSDHWSFVLDVLFCGLTLAGLRYHRAFNMPFWKIDKFIRKHLGPNPFRAHDAIGSKGADFLTWSCLHHLSGQYGALFRPTPELEERKETGESWYPPNHFRPLVDWPLDDEGQEELRTWILGPLFQMTSLMLHERRGHLAHINIIGELCAQFRRGILALMRDLGPDGVIATVESYHQRHPESADGCWFPEVMDGMSSPDWQQLYVNAEHDGQIGVVTLGRESYNNDVDRELNRALDWLVAEGIERVIVSGDFHLAGQLVGADTSDFFAALEDQAVGFRVSRDWSRTARRLDQQFRVSVGFIGGKRCLGGMLELLMHCKYILAVDSAELGMPEVSLPVVPGMEGCHWPFRRMGSEDRPRLLRLLLSGRPIQASAARGWLIDFSGPMEEVLRKAWDVVTETDHGLRVRPLESGAMDQVSRDLPDLPAADSPATETARRAIVECVDHACRVPLAEALEVQARHSAGFMRTPECRGGRVGSEYERTQLV